MHEAALATMPARRGRPRGGVRWTGDRLEAVRIDYEDDTQKTNDVATKHGLDRPGLLRLTRRNKWKRRMSPLGIAAITKAARAR